MKEKYIKPQFLVIDLDMTCIAEVVSKLKTDTSGEGGDFSGGTGFGDDFDEPDASAGFLTKNNSVQGSFVGGRPVY